VSIKASLKNNPLRLLIALLVLHWLAVSFNPAPGQSGRRYGQVWLMAVLQPVQSVLAGGTSGVSSVWNNYFDLRGARAENERLRAEKARLEAELITAREQAKVGEQGAQLASSGAAANARAVVGRVIARDATQWFNTVVIDKGSFQGVERNNPVVTVEGLAGRVIAVAPNASRALLITDERHGAGAVVGQLAASRLTGFVKGRGEYEVEMRVVSPENEKIPAGELIITSGLDGLYPKGLVIGRVAKDVESAQPIPVTPAAPLAKLDVVSVLLVTPDRLREDAAKLADEGLGKPGAPKGRKGK
jgi:rod shape-determining protein MreC